MRRRVPQDQAGPIAARASEVAAPRRGLPTIKQRGRKRRSPGPLPLISCSAALRAEGAAVVGLPAQGHGRAVRQVDRLLLVLDQAPDSAQLDPFSTVSADAVLSGEQAGTTHESVHAADCRGYGRFPSSGCRGRCQILRIPQSSWAELAVSGGHLRAAVAIPSAVNNTSTKPPPHRPGGQRLHPNRRRGQAAGPFPVMPTAGSTESHLPRVQV